MSDMEVQDTGAAASSHSPLNSSFPVLVPYAEELFLSNKDFVAYLHGLPAPPAGRTQVTEKNPTPEAPARANRLVEGLKLDAHRNVDRATLAAENKTLTENADVAFASTGSPLVDLFFELTEGLKGEPLKSHLEAAWAEDSLATLKTIFNARSIHVGKSSKTTAYRAFGWLLENHPKTLLTNLVWLTRPVIEKKMDKDKKPDGQGNPGDVKQTPVDEDDDLVMVDADESANEILSYDVKHGVAHGYWKDLLNILALAINDSFDEPEAVLSVEKPSAKRNQRDWSHENAQARKRERRSKQYDLMIKKFTNDPTYRALHLTVARLFAAQLKIDKELLESGKSRNISLAAKWAPSSKEFHDRHTFVVSTIAELLHGSKAPAASDAEREMLLKHAREAYRQKTLSPLRKALAVVERDISAETFSNIKYERVPSIAMNNYQQLFLSKDHDRFNEYVDKVAEGKAKISGAVLLPSILVAKARGTAVVNRRRKGSAVKQATEAAEKKLLDGQWKTLVQRIKDSGKIESAIAVCDVSGSMSFLVRKDGTCPMDSAIGLSLLLAEVCEPPFGGCFITFSEEPTVQSVGGTSDKRTFAEKVNYIMNSSWGMNTDLVKVFRDLILNIAVERKVPKEDMVKTVFVFSDMQFDQACEPSHSYHGQKSIERWSTSYERIKTKYEEAGYEMPNVVFWNLAGEFKGTKPVEADEPGVGLVSGYSQGMMKVFLDNGRFTNEETIEEEEIVEENGEDGEGTTVRITKKAKDDPASLVKKALSHPSYQMLKVVD